MKAFLKKFEPLEDGTITVTLKVNGDDMNDVVRLYRKDVSLSEPITPGGDSVPTEIAMSILSNVNLMVVGLMNAIKPETAPVCLHKREPEMFEEMAAGG